MVKKGGSKRAPNKMQLGDRETFEPQPREGGRGKGKPSQLEDWKSLKPKPPQPRGGWWGCAKREEFLFILINFIELIIFNLK